MNRSLTRLGAANHEKTIGDAERKTARDDEMDKSEFGIIGRAR